MADGDGGKKIVENILIDDCGNDPINCARVVCPGEQIFYKYRTIYFFPVFSWKILRTFVVFEKAK